MSQTIIKSFVGKVQHSPGIFMSPNDEFALCSDEGVILVSPHCDAADIEGSLKLYLDHIPVPAEAQTFNTGVAHDALIERLIEDNDDAAMEFMYDRNLTPSIESTVSFKAYKCAAWSPNAPTCARSVLALLTLDCRLSLHHRYSTSRHWSKLVDVSDLWSQQVEATNYDLVNERVKQSTENNADVARVRERTWLQSAVDMCFSHCLKCAQNNEPAPKCAKLSTASSTHEGSCCLFITAYKSGHITFWKMKLPPEKSNPVSFIHVTEVSSGGINVLQWFRISEETGLLVVGLQSGEVKALLVEWDPDTEEISINDTTIWTDQDKIAPNVFEWIPEENILLIGKGPFVVAMKLDINLDKKSLKVSTTNHKVIGPYLQIVGLSHRNDTTVAATAGGKIVEIKLNQSKKGIEINYTDLKVDLPDANSYRCHGIRLSNNAVTLASVHYPSKVFCHLKGNRQPLKFCYTGIMDTEEVVQLCLNAESLVGMRDALTNLRQVFTESKSFPEKLQQLIEDKNYSDLNEGNLKLVGFLLQLKLVLDQKEESGSKGITAQDLGEVMSIAMTRHVEKCLQKIGTRKLTDTELLSATLMCKWLEITNSNAALLKKIKNKLKTSKSPEETCVICGEKTLPFSSFQEGGCANGHRFGRCCQTLLLCSEPGYRKCEQCNVLAMGSDQLGEVVWLREVLSKNCTMCDGPLV